MSSTIETPSVSTRVGHEPPPRTAPWQAADRCVVTPTLVLLCGFDDGREAGQLEALVQPRTVEALKIDIYELLTERLERATATFAPGAPNTMTEEQRRLAVVLQRARQDALANESLPATTFRWQRCNSADEVTPEVIKDAAAPMLDLKYWFALGELGLYPVEPRRIPIDVIVVCRHAPGRQAVTEELFGKVREAVQAALAPDADVSLALLVIGDGVVGAPPTGYWPALRVSTRTFNGAYIQAGQMIEVAANLIVALTTTELVDYLAARLSPEQRNRWLWMGASALVADLPAMRQYTQLAVLEKLLQPVVGRDLLQDSQTLVVDTVANRVGLFAANAAQQARLLAKDVGGEFVEAPLLPVAKGGASGTRPAARSWIRERLDIFRATLLNQRQTVPAAHFELADDLRRLVAEPVRVGEEIDPERQVAAVVANGGLPTLPLAPGLVEQLAQAYRKQRANLLQRLAEVESTEYAGLVDFLRSVMDKGLDKKNDDAGQGMLAVPGAQLACPPGLPAAIHATDAAIQCLEVVPDFHWSGREWQPHPLESDEYLANLARSDAQEIAGHYLIYHRRRRSFLSPLGFVFRVIPAWLLLATAIRVVSQWSEARSALWAAIVVATVSGIEALFWWVESTQLRKIVCDENVQRISESLIRLLPTVLRDYRLLVLRYLSQLRHALRGLHELLCDRLAGINDERNLIEARFGSAPSETATTFHLVDLDQCQAFVQDALQPAALGGDAAHPGEPAYVAGQELSRLIAGMMKANQPDLYYQVSRQIEAMAADRVRGALRADALRPETLAGQWAFLAGQSRWSWLSARAQPLGVATRQADCEFTVLGLVGNTALTGAAGLSEEDLAKLNWQTVRSFSKHEILCVRGFVG